MTKVLPAVILLLLCAGASAAELPELVVRAKREAAVDRGLAYLARHQRPDGAFGGAGGGGPDGANGAVAALAELAFLSAGHVPDTGPHGVAVRAAADFLVASVPADGYVGGTDGSRMYGQAVVTLAVAQEYGVEPAADKRRAAAGALDKLAGVLLRARAVPKPAAMAGGWGDAPDAADSNAAATALCALALRAARDAGARVPAEVFDGAADFLRRCAVPDGAGFSPRPGGKADVAATAAATAGLGLLDRGGGGEAVAGMKSLGGLDAAPRAPEAAYAVALAATSTGGDAALALSKTIPESLIASQTAEGGWAAEGEEPVRVSAVAVLTLTVPYRLLPVYQK